MSLPLDSSALRALTSLTFVPAPAIGAIKGDRPALKWLPLTQLRVDPRYQREILARGMANIRQILENFDWLLFTPVICVEVAPNVYAIIDGQHRSTAAFMHPRIREVPCMIVKGDLGAQARAFVSINEAVTRLTPLQIFAAGLAAGDAKARTVFRCCQAAGVIVPGYPKPRQTLKKGETLAIGAIRECVSRVGEYRTALALKALSSADEDGGGLVNRDTVKGLVAAIQLLGAWAADKELWLGRMAQIDLHKIEDDAQLRKFNEGGTLATHIAQVLVSECEAKGWGASLPADSARVIGRAAKPRRGISSY